VPIYEYQCGDCGDSFEIMQKMSEDPLTECEKCGGPLRKVLHPVAIHFKGSGFYTTDYGKGSGRRTTGKDSGSGESSGSGEGSSGDGGPGKGDKKPDEGKAKETQKAT
jgi:putative FmdB family regulatory protein